MASPAARGIRKSLPRRAKIKRPAAEEDEADDDQLPELPRELQGSVFACLPLPDISSSLPCLSRAWAAAFKLSSFRTLCDQAHPNLIAIVGLVRDIGLTIAAFDFASRQWHYRVLSRLVDNYEPRKIPWWNFVYSLFAHGGGLLCFVPYYHLEVYPILVYNNPLTNEWKSLPFLQDPEQMMPVLVRLVVDVTTGRYKVTLVCEMLKKRELCAEVYDSETNLWSMKGDGLVYGVYGTLQLGQVCSPYYDCSTWNDPIAFVRFDHLIASLDSSEQRAEFVSAGEDYQRIFKLKGLQATYGVSEFVRDSGVEEGLREINSYQSSLRVMSGPSNVRLMGSERFLLLVADNCRKGRGRRQKMRVFDLATHE